MSTCCFEWRLKGWDVGQKGPFGEVFWKFLVFVFMFFVGFHRVLLRFSRFSPGFLGVFLSLVQQCRFLEGRHRACATNKSRTLSGQNLSVLSLLVISVYFRPFFSGPFWKCQIPGLISCRYQRRNLLQIRSLHG